MPNDPERQPLLAQTPALGQDALEEPEVAKSRTRTIVQAVLVFLGLVAVVLLLKHLIDTGDTEVRISPTILDVG